MSARCFLVRAVDFVVQGFVTVVHRVLPECAFSSALPVSWCPQSSGVPSCFHILQRGANPFSPGCCQHVEFCNIYAICVLLKLQLPVLQFRLQSLYFFHVGTALCMGAI